MSGFRIEHAWRHSLQRSALKKEVMHQPRAGMEHRQKDFILLELAAQHRLDALSLGWVAQLDRNIGGGGATGNVLAKVCQLL